MTHKTNVCCPYCRAHHVYDGAQTRFYACGTTADRQSGQYQKKCKALDTPDQG